MSNKKVFINGEEYEGNLSIEIKEEKENFVSKTLRLPIFLNPFFYLSLIGASFILGTISQNINENISEKTDREESYKQSKELHSFVESIEEDYEVFRCENDFIASEYFKDRECVKVGNIGTEHTSMYLYNKFSYIITDKELNKLKVYSLIDEMKESENSFISKY